MIPAPKKRAERQEVTAKGSLLGFLLRQGIGFWGIRAIRTSGSRFRKRQARRCEEKTGAKSRRGSLNSHFLSPAAQFTTMVIGEALVSSSGTLSRNR